MGHFLAALLGELFAKEFGAWLPGITGSLLRFAVRRLPENLRERCSEEWGSHLDEVPGQLSKVIVACGFLEAAIRIRHHRSTILDQLVASLAVVYCLPVFVVVSLIIRLNGGGGLLSSWSVQNHEGRRDRVSQFYISRLHYPEFVLYCALRFTPPDIGTKFRSKSHFYNYHYSMWQHSRLRQFERFVEASSILYLPTLFDAVLGRTTLERAFDEVGWISIGKEILDYLERVKRIARH